LGIKLFQPFILRRKAAVAGGIDYQQYFASVLAQVLGGVVLQAVKAFLQNRRAGGGGLSGAGRATADAAQGYQQGGKAPLERGKQRGKSHKTTKALGVLWVVAAKRQSKVA
jgi:hypothetical protein